MATAARLERLRKLVQADVDALPDRNMSPQWGVTGDDDEATGGVSLEPQQLQPPTGKQSSTNGADTYLKEVQSNNKENPERRFVWVKDAESSYNPKTASMRPATAPPPASALPVIDLQRGDLVSARHCFTPILALAKYPYKFCNQNHMQEIASAFFDQGKFWQREWDLYYVWDIQPIKPLVLVRESQVHALLAEINTHLKLSLRITDQQREEGLVTSFPDHPRCLPRYLGRSHSREEYDNMADNAPNHMFRAAGEAAHPELLPPTLEEFKQLMDDLLEVQKAKNKATKAKKQQERLGKQKSMVDQFKRAQRYLGLRPSVKDGELSTSSPPAIDSCLPAPYPFDESVVFVCVDVESYERAHHKITEVGVATLDTRDLSGVAPGVDGEEWRKKIKARHFRIKEHRHLRNGQFVSDFADGFLFGESTFVPLNEAAQHVAACFHAPFGAHHPNDPEGNELMSDVDLDEKRNIIFLGHDTLGDVRYLQQLGYDPMKVENIVEALDTAVMYRVWRREQQPTNLGRILNNFDIIGWRLHNAGNDAVYTVQAMLAICVREASIRNSPELDAMRTDEKATRAATALEEAQQKAKDDAEGWSDHEAEGDGGVPVPLGASAGPAHTSTSILSNSRPIPQHDAPAESRTRGDHRGRGRGSKNYHVERDGYIEGDGGRRGRGNLRSWGRGQMDGRSRAPERGRGQGYSRGRARGTSESNGHSRSVTEQSDSQEHYYW